MGPKWLITGYPGLRCQNSFRHRTGRGVVLPPQNLPIIIRSHQAFVACAAAPGCRSGDRLSGPEALHLSRVAGAGRPPGLRACRIGRPAWRYRRSAGLGQQQISRSVLRGADDGSRAADRQRAPAAGANGLHDQSRRLIGAPGQRRLRPDAAGSHAATA